MKRLNDYRMRMVLVGIVVVIVFDGGRAKADFTFGEPVNLGPAVNSLAEDFTPRVSADGLELYFDSIRPGGYGNYDIWVAKRPTLGDEWSTPVNLKPPVNRSSFEGGTSISADGLELYFHSYNRPGGQGNWDIWVSKRETKSADWGEPANLGTNVNTSGTEATPSISANGLELYFCSPRTGGYGSDDIWVTRRITKDDPWGAADNLGPVVNGPSQDAWPFLSGDGFVLLQSEDADTGPFRSGGFGHADIWLSKRTSVSRPWGAPVNLGPIVNSSSAEDSPCLSSDGKMLYFSSTRPGGCGGYDLWQVPIIPIVDFNGNRIVDAEDMRIMIDHWGTDNSLCDIGPMPWGDGVVDIEDLKVLAEYLFEEVDDPTLVAHWSLDETEGILAHANAAYYDGVLFGNPIWQPDGGMTGGALQLDGVDDYVVIGAAPNPEGDSYSVLAWIKGGTPGQVVLSQMGKADWLCANPSAGTLMTELTMAGRDGSPLDSEAIITDGNWHRIGFVWDGSYRRLYVDGVVVAEDVQDSLDISVNSLYFGTGKAMEPGTFFSGLIDDIRIYNRVVSP